MGKALTKKEKLANAKKDAALEMMEKISPLRGESAADFREHLRRDALEARQRIARERRARAS